MIQYFIIINNNNNDSGQIYSLKNCNFQGNETSLNCYEYHPDWVAEKRTATMLWDFPIHVDREIKANRQT